MMVNGVIDDVDSITYLKTSDKALHMQMAVEANYKTICNLLVSDELRKYFKKNLHSKIDIEALDDRCTFYIKISDM